jgi:prepilin-type N-terminal cleavage/methylation domain-containing protein
MKRTLAHKKRARGYTAVEVLMAMAVLAVGGAGVIAMQRAAVQGNDDARKMDMANTIGREWLERLRRDAMLWTLPNAADRSTNNMANAKFLDGHVTGEWFFPSDHQALGLSPGFDILGRDLAANDLKDAQFCVNVRLSWLVTSQLIRAEVRVFWPRGLGVAPPASYCSANNVAATTGATTTYHFVHMVSALRKNSTE